MEVDIHKHSAITAELPQIGSVSADFGAVKYVEITPERYTGALQVTPSEHTQVLDTSGFYMSGNITVNPIPQNYGKITWDGSTLTVS